MHIRRNIFWIVSVLAVPVLFARPFRRAVL